MKNTDQLNRYIFENVNVRGELVQLAESYQAMLQNHDYPEPIQQIIGELFAATSLLTATLKFEGEIAVQLQGNNGPVSYVAINGSHKQELRGVARYTQAPKSADLRDLLGEKAIMVITITPSKGERYQGVVALDKANLAACLEEYFRQSEQLATNIWLFTDTTKQVAAGMLLQSLPSQASVSTDFADLEHLAQLTNTVKTEELFSLEAEEVLYRLYHQEKVRLFDPSLVSFNCGCSKEKSLNALTSIQPSELKQILAEQNEINVKCEYCLKDYIFKAGDLQHLLNANETPQ
ncbi:Hsp33 family molecular chaperone HslO [Catenovulum maritimum]|uniref:Molecular chaperone Hsp33 n=1 Tax=Catenovulum maritimum TaxID=1513271 RepID=A0A0J8GPA6_9ALTE|nr:Hsp33 family molecular chaperone HslO [Catenovulum maritimum]KMT64607.1 molecular chaperone Hsp33 [Catenovulum maritimum]